MLPPVGDWGRGSEAAETSELPHQVEDLWLYYVSISHIAAVRDGL